MSRKGCKAAPEFQRWCTSCWGRVAALSRHKAAPTPTASTSTKAASHPAQVYAAARRGDR
ncbi:hypothetical protein DM807_09610 [Pseudomonas hunanensis]|nr:hypothetical protein [Pseudomonas hunanensis]RNF69589.1 hypothetical protein EFJ98_16790 [Pseudomonas putida]